ncbi:MAG: dockerin type I domain-containing protein [Paraprevotella sp.]|nr:dockerin type I domain-containing protein [Paraprevotella sp.]
MNKKVLVSILAMTSASTMTAWANANVKELKNGSLLDWGIKDSEGTNLTLADGVITSPDGTAISQKINLAPGTYKFKYDDGTRNVTVKINGQEIADNNEFTVEGDAEQEITIELSATEEGKEFVVGNPELTLLYDFNAARLVLEGQLRDAINKIVEGDDEATELSNKASEIANRLKLLVDNTEGAYQAYVDNQMWKGTAGCKFASEIEAVDKKADAQGANMSAYQTALDSIQAQQKALDAVNATLESYKELTNGTYDYTTGITTGMPETIQGQIDNYKKTADEAHKAGNAASVLTAESNKAFTDAASEAIEEFKGLVKDAPANHEAYLYIKERVAALKAQEEKALQEIYKALTDTLDVYEDSRKEAQNELNAILVQVVQIENQNGTEDNHQGSKVLRDNNEVALGTSEVKGSFAWQIDSIQSKWTDNAAAWKAAYADAKKKVANKQEALNDWLKIQAIQDKHKDATDAIQELITALSEKIEKDYAEHTIVKNAYKTQLNDIQKALDKLDTDAADDIANYNAYQALQSKIDDAQKHLDKAKEDVDSLTSGVEGIEYSTTGKYETTKGTLDQALQSIKDQIEKDFTEETCAGKTYDFDGFKTDVDEFVSDAKTARDNYVKIQQSLTDFGAQMIELNDTVTIKDVVISGTNPEETYGQRIKDLQDKIDNIDSTFVAAKLKTDSVYNKDLSTIAGTLSTVSTDLANFKKLVKENYGNDKEAYENELTKQAIETIISESNKVIAKAEADLGEIVLEGILNKDDVDSEETKGLSSRKTDLENQIKEQKTIVNKDYSNVENKSEVYERLYNAKVKIDSIKIDIEQLQKDVEESKKGFQANEKKYTTLNGYLTNLSDSIQKVRDDYDDENRKEEFEGEPGGIVTKLKASYDKLKDDIVESYNKQTVVEDSKDIVPEEGETKPGFDSRIQSLTNAISDAQVLAKACAENRAAYDDTEVYRKSLKISTAISNARKAIKYNENWGTYEGARAYYKGLLSGYVKDNTQLTDSIWTVYEEERASAKKQKAFEESLYALLVNVNAVPGLVTNNNQGYNEMCGTHAAILKTWTEAYAFITANDESSKQEEYLDSLTAIKSDLTMAKASIEEHFNGGLYGPAESVELSADRSKLQEISTRLTKVQTGQEEGYKALIDADNLNRHNEFLDTLTATRTYWRQSVEIVEQYKSLKNEELRAVAGDAATTASTEMNKILSELNTIQTKELAEYTKILETEEADLFDKTESFKGEVTKQYNKIADAMKALDDDVYKAAQDLLGDKLEIAKQACTAAHGAIVGITEEDSTQQAEVLEAATDYWKAKGYVDEATEANGKGKDFALKVESCLANLAEVDRLLASAKEQAADKEWELYYGKARSKKTAEENALNDTLILTKEARADYLQKYADAWTENGVNMFINLNDSAQVDDFFSKITELKGSLNRYASAATVVYNAAKAESDKNIENEKAYAEKSKSITVLENQLDSAVAYAERYASFYLESVQRSISDCQAKIATAKSELEKAYKNAVSQDYDLKEKEKEISGAITKLYVDVNTAEQTWLNTQAVDLDGQYNNAYKVDSVATQALEDDKKRLQNEIPAYTWADEDGTPTKENDTIQSDLLKFESEIATLRSQLLEISAPGNEAAIIESLNGQLNDVRTSYEKKHGLLEEKDLTNKEGDLEERGFTKEEINAIKDLDVVGNTIAEIQNKIDACEAEDGKILLNQTAIEQAIGKVKSEMEGLTGKIDELVAKYDANEAAYAKLSAKIAEDKAKLLEAEDDIKALTTIDRVQADLDINGIDTLINKEDSVLKVNYEKTALTAESTVTDFSKKIAGLLKQYTYQENSNLIDSLQSKITKASTTLSPASNVMNKEDLLIKIDSLATSAQNLSNYNVDAEDGKVKCDIDGNKTEKTVDYVDEASPAIGAKLNELKETLAALEKTIGEYTYVVGDADGDGNVQVTDYMTVMKLVLGTESVKEGTVNFLRADANGDGKINNGDLVAVVNKILGIRTVDALEQVLATNSMESVGEVKMAAVEGVASKKIAIQLSSTNKYAACQMDVNIPAGVTVTSSSIEGLQNHSLYSAEQTDGTLRLVVSSLENAVMDTEGNATIYLEVEGNNAEAITVSNVTAADVAGATYNIVDKGEATGINGVVSNANSASLKQRIYSVGGQMMDGVKKGINIIMNSDGTARKVLKK